MPSKNVIKLYAPDSYYHIYNRGVEKRVIFNDDLDYRVFLSYLKVALTPQDSLTTDNELSVKQIDRLRRLNLADEVELLAYCLLPNHFHLFVYQKSGTGIQKLMRSIMTGYVMYFNKRSKRVGPLFQNIYKASLIDNEAYLWHVSRYIHLNALDAGSTLEDYPYSSYEYYVGKRAKWVKPNRILAMHQEYKQDYNQFVHDYKDHKQTLDEIKHQLANH